MGSYDPSFNLEACAASVSYNGDLTVINDHIDVTEEEVVSVILEDLENNPNNGTNNGTDVTGLCPNDCNTHGSCIIGNTYYE